MNLKRLCILAVTAIAFTASLSAQKQHPVTQRFGVAFYNLENLFDTIPNNPLGRDDEFTNKNKNQWGSKKYMNMKRLEAMEQELLIG